MKRYVIVVESADESGQRGVDGVYAGPGEGFVHWEAVKAQEALREWLKDEGGATATIVELSQLPDRARGRMARAVMEAEAAQQAKLEQTRLAVVTDVTPPVTELWESIKEERA